MTEKPSRFGLGAAVVRLWLLVYFGVMGFVLLSMFLFLLAIGGRVQVRSDGPWDAVAMTLIPIYALFHISAFVGVMKKVSWAWRIAILVVSFDLVLHGGIVALSAPAAHADMAQKIFLLTCPTFSLVLLMIPSVKPRLGSRVGT